MGFRALAHIAAAERLEDKACTARLILNFRLGHYRMTTVLDMGPGLR